MDDGASHGDSARLATFRDNLTRASSLLAGLNQPELLSALRLAMQLQDQVVNALTPSNTANNNDKEVEDEGDDKEDAEELDTVALESEIIGGPLARVAQEDKEMPLSKRVKLEPDAETEMDSEEPGFSVVEAGVDEEDSCDQLIVDPEDGGFIIPGFTIVEGSTSHCRPASSASALSSFSPTSTSSSSLTASQPQPLPSPFSLLMRSSRLITALTRAAALAATADFGASGVASAAAKKTCE